jgi:hypothetical protein
VPDLEALTADDFAPHLRERFALSPTADSAFDVELIEVSGAGARPFSLVFRGPGEPVLPQRIYRLEHPALGALDLFLVPIGRQPDGLRYEAVFA